MGSPDTPLLRTQTLFNSKNEAKRGPQSGHPKLGRESITDPPEGSYCAALSRPVRETPKKF